MTNKEIYINKIYSSMTTYLKVKRVNDYTDAYLELQEYLNNLEREDIETIKNHFPSEFINKTEVEEIEIKKTIDNIIKQSKEYQLFFNDYAIPLKENLDQELSKRGFVGTYPKYYLEKAEELLVLEFDDDIFLNAEDLLVNRQGLLIRIKNYQEIIPNFDINNFSYMSLFINYLDDVKKGLIRTFMIKLPSRDYSKELSEQEIKEDIKYLEIVDCVLENRKYLPKWYINNNKTEKMIYKEYFLFVLLFTAFIGSFINLFLFKGNLGTLIIVWLIIGVIDHFICKALAKKKYQSYHNIDEK